MRDVVKLISEKTNNNEDDIYKLLDDKTYQEELIDKYWFLTDEIKNSKIYYSLEGYLFPATYNYINKEIDVKKIFSDMLDKTWINWLVSRWISMSMASS